jgi:hypothetical protein
MENVAAGVEGQVPRGERYQPPRIFLWVQINEGVFSTGDVV